MTDKIKPKLVRTAVYIDGFNLYYETSFGKSPNCSPMIMQDCSTPSETLLGRTFAQEYFPLAKILSKRQNKKASQILQTAPRRQR